MGTAHGADDSPLELQVGQKISTPHPPCPLDLWSKQCAILLGSGPENQICARTRSLHSMTWPYPCHQYTRAGDLARGDTPRYVLGTWWCPKSSGVWAVLGAPYGCKAQAEERRTWCSGNSLHRGLVTDVFQKKGCESKAGTLFHMDFPPWEDIPPYITSSVQKYCSVPPDTTKLLHKKTLYRQYKGIRLSWHFVPVGIFLYSLAFNSTFNLILAFNSIHLLLACALLDICEDPRWVNHTQPHSLKLAQLIVKDYKPDCYQEKNYLRQKFSYFYTNNNVLLMAQHTARHRWSTTQLFVFSFPYVKD